MRLGVNIDHVATLRNARGGDHPDPVLAAWVALRAGADLITAHLREDRRHIVDDDVKRLLAQVPLPLNLEMAATESMVSFAVLARPAHVCLVPERREERTTESGLDVLGLQNRLAPAIDTLKAAGIQVTLFVDPLGDQIRGSQKLGADAVELNTGAYSDNPSNGVHLQCLRDSAELALAIGLECHAGHGLSYGNVQPVAAIPGIVELNIGHFLIGESILSDGLAQAVRHMKKLIEIR